MASYLQHKYGEEFIVGPMRREGSGLGVEGSLVAKAHPKNNSSLEFDVSMNSYGKSDKYPNALWVREQAPNVEKHLRKIFGFIPTYRLEVGLSFDNKTALPYGKPYAWSRIVEDSRYITFFDLTTTVDSPELSLDSVKMHEKKAKQLFTFVKQQNTSTFNATYSIKSSVITNNQLSYFLSSGAKRSNIKCYENLSVDEKTYAAASMSTSLESYYGKWCSYKSSNGSSGGGETTSTYPGATTKYTVENVRL